MLGHFNRVLYFSVASLMLASGCSGQVTEADREAQGLRVASKYMKQAVANMQSVDASDLTPYMRDYRLPAFKRGLEVLRKPGLERLDEPVPLSVIFDLVESPNHPRPTLALEWLESGLDLQGFFIKDGEAVVGEFKVLGTEDWPEEDQRIFSGSAYRVRGVAVLLDNTPDDGLGKLRLEPSIRLPSKLFSSGKLRVGLIRGNGKHTAAIEAYVKGPAGPKKPFRTSPLKVGEVAPELQVGAWTDGKRRKLADYRGKVVCLTFLGDFSEISERQWAWLKKMHKEYEKHGVVFLYVHPPGMDISEIREVLQRAAVPFPTALDEGDTSKDGSTAWKYGVFEARFAIFVIDRNGKVTCNTADPGFTAHKIKSALYKKNAKREDR